MNYLIIIGIGVSIIGSIITGIGYVKQYQENKVKDAELIEYRKKSLDNQNLIIDKSDIIFQKTEEVSQGISENQLLSKQQFDESKKQFEIENRPNLVIENLKLNQKEYKYVLFIKNYGKSIAEIIKLHIDYSTPLGKGVIQKWEQLPSDKTSIVQIDILNLYDKIQHLPDIKKEYDAYIDKFNKNERSFITNLKLEYEWNNKTFYSRDYIIIHSRYVLTLN